MKLKVKVSLAVLLGAVVVVSAVVLPLADWTLHLVDWIRQSGWAGAFAYAVAYLVATVLLLPGSVLTLAAGFLYGPVLGMVLVSPISVLAATAAFLSGRFLAGDWVARRVARNPKFLAIDQAISRGGFKIVLLLRVSPVFPFNLLNYALGITSVRLRDYMVASWIGMLPGTFLYVYLGSSVTSTAELLSGRFPQGSGPWQQVLFWAGLAATGLLVAFITRAARRELQRTLETQTEEMVPQEVAS